MITDIVKINGEWYVKMEPYIAYFENEIPTEIQEEILKKVGEENE